MIILVYNMFLCNHPAECLRRVLKVEFMGLRVYTFLVLLMHLSVGSLGRLGNLCLKVPISAPTHICSMVFSWNKFLSRVLKVEWNLKSIPFTFRKKQKLKPREVR